MKSTFGRKKLALLGLALFSLALSAILITIWFSTHREQELSKKRGLYPRELGTSFPCPGTTENITLTDVYLPGKIEPGQSVRIIWNWYACHSPRVGDLVLVRISRDLPPKPKVIRAVSGDSIALAPDPSNDRWNLSVNNQPILDFQNVKYAFGGKALPPIGRYIQARGSILGQKDVVVLSTRSPGEMDSGTFGVLGVDDLVAKIELE